MKECYFTKTSSGVILFAAHHDTKDVPAIVSDLRRLFGNVQVSQKPVDPNILEPLDDEKSETPSRF